MGTLRLKSFAAGAAVLGVFAAVACSSQDHGGSGGSGGGDAFNAASSTTGSGGGGEGGHIGSGGGIGVGCHPDCGHGQFCSTANVCIDDGTCLGDGDCGADGYVCDKDKKKCVPGGCDSTLIPSAPVPPNLLLTLDRSCSMTDAVGDKTKWEIAVAAIQQMTTDFDGKIRFGLTLFPDTFGDNCAQDAPLLLDVGAGHESQIQTILGAALSSSDPNYPSNPCVTNIDTAVGQAAADMTLTQDMDHAGFVLLMTDGKQSKGCSEAGGNAGTLSTIQSLATSGIQTFVVGFGSGVDSTDLDAWATAGGVPSMGTAHAYYDAEDQQSLDTVLETIATQTISCVYQLDTAPPDDDKIYVFFDGTKVLRDPSHQNGWDYDPATKKVTFYGMSCGELQMGQIDDVQIVYGCDQPPPP